MTTSVVRAGTRILAAVLVGLLIAAGITRATADEGPDLMDGWHVYDYRAGLDVVPAVNVFEPAVAVGDAVWANHRQWSIDDPESPPSVLALVRYDEWTTATGRVDAARSEGSEVTCLRFELRATDLDLRGGVVDFWLVSSTLGERWHSPPLEVDESWTEHEVRPGEGWRNSWRRDRADPADLAGVIRSTDSIGVGFVGFDGEPTGMIGLRNLRSC
jgi:hypothetical protein